MQSLVLSWLASCLIFTTTTLADQGLVGFGLDPTGDFCSYACLQNTGLLALQCSTLDPASGIMFTTHACRANDTPWLTTVAWCLRTYCTDATPAELEANFATRAGMDLATFGRLSVPLKWTYHDAIERILTSPQGLPTREIQPTDLVLNFTGVVPELGWLKHWNASFSVQREQHVSAIYAIILLVIGFGTPIMLTWGGYLPFASRVSHLVRLKSRLIYPSTIGTYSVRPLPYLLGNAPTRGQAFALVLFLILNLILSTVNYRSFQPNAYRDLSFEVAVNVTYRTGIFAFALIPLMLLFSSRNNVLLWWTNWPHSTYILLHKWIARLFFLYSLVHTLVALPFFYDADSKKEYWIWGAVAIVAMAVILLTSVLWVRKKAYEVFLATHVVLSVITLVGCWYHVTLWVPIGVWGYETWLYAACAVWFFDRLARFGRVLKNGVRRARVVDIGPDHVRVDLPGVRWGTGDPGSHVYVYFPFMSASGEWWRQPWENHPFSVVPTVLLHKGAGGKGGNLRPGSDSAESAGHHHHANLTEGDIEKNGVIRSRVSSSGAGSDAGNESRAMAASGITLFIKKSTGITKHLRANNNLVTLLDGPYSNSSTREIRHCDRLLLIGGGIGITSLLPWIVNHENVKLCWSVREAARFLLDEAEGPLSRVHEKDVRVGSRLNFDDLLGQEIDAGWKKVGVVVSGPGGLCDDVRAAVVAAGKKSRRTAFELEVDAYTW